MNEQREKTVNIVSKHSVYKVFKNNNKLQKVILL